MDGPGSGTQAGTGEPDASGVTLLLSHPHPAPGVTPFSGTGLVPGNPSRFEVTMFTWPPQDGESANEKNRSLMAKLDARADKLGTCEGW